MNSKYFYYIIGFLSTILCFYFKQFSVQDTMFIDVIFMVIAIWAIAKARGIENE